MKKVLLVTTVSGFVPQFEMNNVKLLQNMGYEVHYASNYHMPSYGSDNHRLDGTGIIRHQVDFVRSPFNQENRKAYRQLKNLMKREKFELIHCHTPMGGVLTRLAAHKTGSGPVIYTAHGFHFFKGAPLKNWLFYYPVEKFLSRYTKQQICINREDFRVAKEKFKAEFVDYIPGVGIDFSDIIPVTEERRIQERRNIGISQEKILLFSVGELIKRKNHETIIKAIAEMNDNRLIYAICGHGELEEYLKNMAKKMGIEKQVVFLGYRSDVYELYSAADLFVFPSYQEGLPRALLEAMGSGLPVVCSDIRGSCDLMREAKISEDTGKPEEALTVCRGGVLIKKADDKSAYVQGISYMINNRERWSTMGLRNREKTKEFDIKKVSEIMQRIYERILSEINEGTE